jgi:8-oxo-dGTP diphosphatase
VEPFCGCKLALLIADRILVYTRDDFDWIPYPGQIDLPGGAREGGESPDACVLRELEEEFGLRLPAARLLHRHRYRPPHEAIDAWFFAATLLETEVAAIRFGDEGKDWMLMPVAEFLAHESAIAHLRACLRDYLGPA